MSFTQTHAQSTVNGAATLEAAAVEIATHGQATAGKFRTTAMATLMILAVAIPTVLVYVGVTVATVVGQAQ
jgi:hypothetical protein